MHSGEAFYFSLPTRSAGLQLISNWSLLHTTSTGFTVERGDRDLVPMSSSSIDRSEVCFLIDSYFQVAWCCLCPHLCSRSRRSIPFSASTFAGLSRGLLCVSSSGHRLPFAILLAVVPFLRSFVFLCVFY